MMPFFFVALLILLIGLVYTRPSARPHIGRKAWGIASPQREAVRFFLSLTTGITALYVNQVHSEPVGHLLMTAAWAVALSWVPGAFRQSRRLDKVPDSLAAARAAIASERVPDLTLLAVLITPPGNRDIPPWMNLQRNARFLDDMPDSDTPADGVPALRKFIEAAIFGQYWSHPFNEKPGRRKCAMNDYEMSTTLDIYFEDILVPVYQFVQEPTERWNNIADAAMAYGVDAALEYGDIPVEYLDTLAERREYVRLGW